MQPLQLTSMRATIEDAENGRCRDIVVTSDRNGITIEVDSVPRLFVFDVAGDVFRLFITNDNGEVDSPPLFESM